MREKKRILSFLLALIMTIMIIPVWTTGVNRADTADLMTPTLSDDGLLKWDPSVRDVYLSIEGESGVYSILGATQFDLNEYFRRFSYRNTECYIELYGKVNGEYQLMWSGTFRYEAKYGILDTPVNIAFNEDYVLSWDTVPNATSYVVYLCNSSGGFSEYSQKIHAYTNQVFVDNLLVTGSSQAYQFAVVALSDEGYQRSDAGLSGKYTVSWAGKWIGNVTFSDDGTMMWDEVEGAVKYKITVYHDDQPYAFFCDSNSVNIDEKIRNLLPGKTPDYFDLDLQAYNETNPISYIWKGGRSVDVIAYDLFISGIQVTNVNLDVFGDGFCIFDPQTNTLHLNTDVYFADADGYLNGKDALDGIIYFPFIEAGIDLTIDGKLIIPSQTFYPIFVSTKKITFAEDFELSVYSSYDPMIRAADIEFMGGTYDIQNGNGNVIEAENNIVIHNGIKSIRLLAPLNSKTMLAKNGTITLDGVLIDTPSGAMISSDGHRIVEADGQTDPSTVILVPDPNYIPVTPIPDPPTPEPVTPAPETPTPEPSTPAPEPAKDPSFEDFVERLYVVALGRASEAEGKAFWVDQVVNKGLTGADCARFFMLGAPEFLGRNLTDDEFVEVLYKTYFDRDSEPDGKAYWMGRLASGEDRAVLVEEFIESVEWCNVCATYGVKSGAQWHKATIASKNAIKFATRLYTCCLVRDPEADGLEYWSLALTNLEVSGYQAASLFFESPEFQGFNTTNEEYIKRLYTTFMGREADADGFNYWLGLLNSGTSRTDAMKAFASCPEFQEICNQYGIDRGEI